MISKKRVDFRLYLVTDRNILAKTGHSSLGANNLYEAVEDALRGGVRAVQLREKDLAIRGLLDLAYRMRELTARYDSKLFINDRVDIALCVEADGVHLGQSGIPVHAARKIVGEGMLIGASAHSEEEVFSAEREGADFIAFGPLYPTPSKKKYGEPLGTGALRKIRGRISVPVFGIGGIKTDNIREVIHSGARGIALISGILSEADIKRAAERYLRMLE